MTQLMHTQSCILKINACTQSCILNQRVHQAAHQKQLMHTTLKLKINLCIQTSCISKPTYLVGIRTKLHPKTNLPNTRRDSKPYPLTRGSPTTRNHRRDLPQTTHVCSEQNYFSPMTPRSPTPGPKRDRFLCSFHPTPHAQHGNNAIRLLVEKRTHQGTYALS